MKQSTNNSTQLLSAFLQSHRERFCFEDSHKFAFALAQVTRYVRFLDGIFQRYLELAKEEHAYISRRRSGQKFKIGESDRSLEVLGNLEFEMESFFVFAKAMLDRCAQFIQLYFGEAKRSSPLFSHDQFVKNIREYARTKTLQLNPQFISTAEELKRFIVDIRDKQFTHEKGPLTARAMMTSPDGRFRMVLSKWFPRENSVQKELPCLEDATGLIDCYLRLVIEFIEVNEDKTLFKPVETP